MLVLVFGVKVQVGFEVTVMVRFRVRVSFGVGSKGKCELKCFECG